MAAALGETESHACLKDLPDMQAMAGLMHQVSSGERTPHSKVTVVGVGQVGMACAYSVLVQHLASELALVDVNADKLRGEMMDLQHGLAFIKHCRVRADTDYAVTAGSKMCIVTAGARQREGEGRLQLVQRNVAIFAGIVPKLVEHSPDTIIMVVSNPVDVLTYVTWRLSGLPRERVFGSGTNLDSARFRFLLSQRLHIAPSSVHGWIVGEHGDSSVAVWSGANVAGVPLAQLNPSVGDKEADPEHWQRIHQQVVTSAYEIIRLKGYTSWAIGLSVAAICAGILKDTRNIYALSTNVKGMHGIDTDVYLSLPCVVGERGIVAMVNQNLNEAERGQLHKSAKALKEVQDGLKF